MLQNASTPNSPDWWLLRLGRRLYSDHDRLDRLYKYWRGEHELPFGNRKMREAYRRFQKQSRTNMMKLVTESVVERLTIKGFRVGGADDADKDAWAWWLANNMNADSSLVHRAAVTMSRAYVIVGKDAKTGKPIVTGEDPRSVIHEPSPLNRRDTLAAMKVYRDDIEGEMHAVVYLPDAIHYYVTAPGAADKPRGIEFNESSWQVDTSTYADGQASNPLGEVPVVPFSNHPDLAGRCLGEFEDVTPIQDRINTEVLDRMVISSMQAYRQRWGVGVSSLDEDGNPASTFDPGADLVWLVDDPQAKFGDFQQADLSPILSAVTADVESVAAITRTPPHYLVGQMVNVSGDALAAAETGLVSKVLERSAEFGQSWANVHRLATRVQGNTPADDVAVMWADPQFRTQTEAAAANVQLMTAGVPWRTRMALLDFSPGEIDRMETERAADALLNPNPDYTIPGPSAPPAGPGGTAGTSPSAPVAPKPPPGGQGGAAQPAARAARAASPNRTGAPAGAPSR